MATTQHSIAELQAAYKARPFGVYINSRYFSGGFRFDSEHDAVAYVAQQFVKDDFQQATMDGPGRIVTDWTSFDIHS